MAWYRAGGGGIPSAIKTDMNAVLNKKFGTSTDYPPTDWAPSVNLLGPLPEKMASGSVANITDGADGVPVKNWGVTVDATLSGVSSVVCTQAGKNFIPLLTWYTAGYQYTNAGVTFEVLSDGGIRITGKSTGTYSQFNIVSYTSAPTTSWQLYVPASTYAFSLKNITSDIRMVTSGSSNNGFPYSEVTYSAQTKTGAVTDASKPFNYIILRVYPTADNIDVTVYPQLEIGSTATAFEKYVAPTVSTVNLGRTIYGGSVDVVNGTGEEEYIKVTFDGSDDEGWAKTNAGPYYSTITGYYKEQGFINGICDSFTMVAEVGLASNMTTDLTCSFYFGNDQNRFYIRYDAMADAAALKTWLSQNPVTIVYKVATSTPFTFDPITPTPETALGVNNFWADEGDSEVTYRADIDLLLGGN